MSTLWVTTMTWKAWSLTWENPQSRKEQESVVGHVGLACATRKREGGDLKCPRM